MKKEATKVVVESNNQNKNIQAQKVLLRDDLESFKRKQPTQKAEMIKNRDRTIFKPAKHVAFDSPRLITLPGQADDENQTESLHGLSPACSTPGTGNAGGSGGGYVVPPKFEELLREARQNAVYAIEEKTNKFLNLGDIDFNDVARRKEMEK